MDTIGGGQLTSSGEPLFSVEAKLPSIVLFQEQSALPGSTAVSLTSLCRLCVSMDFAASQASVCVEFAPERIVLAFARIVSGPPFS